MVLFSVGIGSCGKGLSFGAGGVRRYDGGSWWSGRGWTEALEVEGGLTFGNVY